MEKPQKKANYKTLKSKRKQPLRVVYITNPIKFTTSASEFRALVQELTGQDAGTPYSVFSPEDGGGEGPKSLEQGNAHAVLEETEMADIGQFSSEVAEVKKPDPHPIYDPNFLGFGSFDDCFVSSMMIESFQGKSNLVEVLESLDAM